VNLNWKNVRLQKALEDAFHCPAVVLNDVDAGVYGENQLGAAKKARTVVGIFPGTGIGGGCVYDGQIIRGNNLSAMEIGHLEVTHNGNLCGCGRRGCLETEASRLAISAEIAKAAYRGETPYLRQVAGTDISNIRSGVLADAIAAGDTVVEHIIRRAAYQIGIAVANVVHLICPDTVVLGGGLVEAMPDLFVTEVTESAANRVMPSFVGSFKVVAAELGDFATVKGAAAWVRNVVKKG
jgi:glucokinase